MVLSISDRDRRCRNVTLFGGVECAQQCRLFGQGCAEVRRGRTLRSEERPDRSLKVQLQSTRAPQMGLHLRHRVAVVSLCLGVLVEPFGIAAVCAQDRGIRKAPAVDRSPAADTVTHPLMPPRQCICTMEYNPVCGRTADGAILTFSNPCRARCAGATVIRPGLC